MADLTTNEKLTKLLKLSNEKELAEGILQRIELNPDQLVLSINNIPIDNKVLPDYLMLEILPVVVTRLKARREHLIDQATELMKK